MCLCPYSYLPLLTYLTFTYLSYLPLLTCHSCGMRCFFSVCAWLQWTRLNGAFVAATKVVGAGILVSHWPLCVRVTSLSHSPITHITSPSRPVHEYMGIKVLQHPNCGPFPLPHHGVFSTPSSRMQWFIFFYITVILKYLLIIIKVSKCWVVSLPSYLRKFLNILCWSAPWGSSSRVGNTWKEEIVRTAAFNWSLFSMRIRTELSCFLISYWICLILRIGWDVLKRALESGGPLGLLRALCWSPPFIKHLWSGWGSHTSQLFGSCKK